jgi:transketolase
MVGIAAGLALRGRIPVIHALATFLTLRAFEFIRTDVGIGNLPVKLIGGVPGFLSDGNGPTHQAIEDVSIMRGIPNMHVFCPSDADELVEAMPQIVDSPSPWYVRYNAAPAEFPHTKPFHPGSAEMLIDGDQVALMSYGFIMREVWKAAQILRQRGHSVRVLNMRTIYPIDEAAILHAASETSLLVTVEDHLITGGLHSVVAETLLKSRTTARVLPLALDRWFKPGLLPDVLRYEGFTGTRIAERVRQAL